MSAEAALATATANLEARVVGEGRAVRAVLKAAVGGEAAERLNREQQALADSEARIAAAVAEAEERLTSERGSYRLAVDREKDADERALQTLYERDKEAELRIAKAEAECNARAGPLNSIGAEVRRSPSTETSTTGMPTV